MSWAVLEKLLTELSGSLSLAGKIWITFLFIFRVIVVLSIGDKIFSDEQSRFHCDTNTPGCANVCFNRFNPISPIRFWACQILFVSSPSIVFILWFTQTAVGLKSDAMKISSGKKEKRFRAAAKRAQYIRLSFQLIFEALFGYLQFYLYSWRFQEHFECNPKATYYTWVHSWKPCVGTIECYLSRPQEKNIFLWYMYVSSGLCICLTIAEIKMNAGLNPVNNNQIGKEPGRKMRMLRNREKQFSESYEGKEEPKPSRSSKLALNTDVSIIDFEIDEDIAIEF